jgi:hypothetical protein
VKESITNLQQELLKVFHYELDERQLLEVKNLLSNYFAEKATSEMERLWTTNNWNEETMKEWAKEHTRTPHKS